MGILFGEGSLLQSLTNPTDWWDYFKNGKSNDVNQNIANQNLGFQRENLDYQKALQREIFEREDTAYQRTVSDMRSAGLNPLTMQGTNNAGEAISTESMHNDMQYTDNSNLQAVSQILDVMNQIKTTSGNASVAQAQSNLINAQADSQKIKNIYEEELLKKNIESLDLSNIGKRFSNERENIAWLNDQDNYMFNQRFGISNNMPDFVKNLNYFTHQGNLEDDYYIAFDRDWNSFGNTFNSRIENPSFSSLGSLLEDTNLKGALQSNVITNALLSLLGIK